MPLHFSKSNVELLLSQLLYRTSGYSVPAYNIRDAGVETLEI